MSKQRIYSIISRNNSNSPSIPNAKTSGIAAEGATSGSQDSIIPYNRVAMEIKNRSHNRCLKKRSYSIISRNNSNSPSIPNAKTSGIAAEGATSGSQDVIIPYNRVAMEIKNRSHNRCLKNSSYLVTGIFNS
jgi:PP-loop superfamily ATP-utilizing enzyme